MSVNFAIRGEEGSSPYEIALNAALADLAKAQSRADQNRSRIEHDQALIAGLKQVIHNIVEILPADRRALYLQRLNELHIRAEPPARGGPVFDNVVSLFQRSGQRKWTTSEVQRELASEGVHADAKAVANVLGYLSRTGKIRRIARGHYAILKAGGLVTDQEIEGTDYGARLTEHDF